MFSLLQRSIANVRLVSRARGLPSHAITLRHFVHVAGDWNCACGFTNFASRSACLQCRKQKPLFLRAAGEMSATGFPGARFVGYRYGDWVCTCGSHNFARRENCMKCTAPRPSGGNDRSSGNASETDVKKHRLLPGDWICPGCSTHNFRGRARCMSCGAGAPVAGGMAADCNEEMHMGASKIQKGEVGSGGMYESPWTCTACHTVNVNASHTCEACASTRVDRVPCGSSPASTPADWTCKNCGFLNFSSRVKCKSCKTPNLSDAVEVDENIWVCECGYKNLSHRILCRDCKAPKPEKQ